jgi:hypothetical protein
MKPAGPAGAAHPAPRVVLAAGNTGCCIPP